MKHREMYLRAFHFKRELGYDLLNGASTRTTRRRTAGVYGNAAIVGACAFRWREYRDAPAGWAMQWVWLTPKARRRGILARHWPEFRRRFGDFRLEPPLSEAMEEFARKQFREEQRV
jgi:hypothetical protein